MSGVEGFDDAARERGVRVAMRRNVMRCDYGDAVQSKMSDAREWKGMEWNAIKIMRSHSSRAQSLLTLRANLSGCCESQYVHRATPQTFMSIDMTFPL